MGKRAEYAASLAPLLADSSLRYSLEEYLVSRSYLPGPAANLELSWAFADLFSGRDSAPWQWEMLLGWAAIPPEEASTNEPRAFLPLCALQALGSCYTVVEACRQEEVRAILRSAASDPRWRMREAVAMALQRMGEADFSTLRDLLSSWLERASHLEQRAAVAALAHPPSLADPEVARYSLAVSDRILANIVPLGPEARKAEEYRVLRQGLEYAVSVFVAALPGEGFPFLGRWAGSDDPDIRRIVRSNLGKARLAKKFPAEVAAVQVMLGE